MVPGAESRLPAKTFKNRCFSASLSWPIPTTIPSRRSDVRVRFRQGRLALDPGAPHLRQCGGRSRLLGTDDRHPLGPRCPGRHAAYVHIDEALRLAADRVSAEIEALLAGKAAVDRQRSGSQARDIAPHVEPVTDTSRPAADPGSARIARPD